MPAQPDITGGSLATVAEAPSARTSARGLEPASAIGLWLAMLHHDLKAPLQIVLGAAELIASESSREEERRQLERLLRGAAELDRLILEVRTGLIELMSEPSSVRLHDAVMAAVAEIRGEAARAHTRIVVCSSATVATVRGPAVWVRQAIVNLVRNAVRHGGSTVILTVDPPMHDTVEITVEDNGEGIDPTERTNIDEIFRGDARRPPASAPVAGLGLTWELMAAMGGRLVVEEPARGGASIRLSFPTFSPPRPPTLHVP